MHDEQKRMTNHITVNFCWAACEEAVTYSLFCSSERHHAGQISEGFLSSNTLYKTYQSRLSITTHVLKEILSIRYLLFLMPSSVIEASPADFREQVQGSACLFWINYPTNRLHFIYFSVIDIAQPVTKFLASSVSQASAGWVVAVAHNLPAPWTRRVLQGWFGRQLLWVGLCAGVIPHARSSHRVPMSQLHSRPVI